MKKWTKLFSLAIGIFVAIGAAVGVKQTAERVNAESETISFMTNATNLGYSSGTQSNLSMTVDDVTLTFSSISAKNGDKVQLVKSGTISSTSFAGAITSIKVYDCQTTSAKTDGSFELLGSTNGSSFTSIDTVSGLSSTATNKTFSVDSSKNYTYFKIVNGSARVLLTSEIDVTYYVDDSEGDKTLDSILDVSATITARQGDTEWTINDASATGIVSGVPNQDVTSMVNFSIETDVPSTAGQTNVTLRATKKDSVEGDATYFEKTISAIVTENPFASFTKVTDADDVSSNCIYALSNDGNNFVGNSISNSTLAYPAADNSDIGFFKLLDNGGLQLVTENDGVWNGTSNTFINNSDSTNLSLGSKSSNWAAKENSSLGVYLTNTSNNNRHLGLNQNSSTGATGVKAYASSNINTNLPVYLYEVYRERYTVKFYNDGVQYGADVEVLDGEKLTKPADPSRENYTFAGWEDADGNLWDFDNDTVDSDDVDADGVMILTSVWNNDAEVALQEDLNIIKPWMSLAYRYNDTRNYQNITIGIISSHKDEESKCENNTEKNLTTEFANDAGITFVWNSGTGTNWWFKQNDFRLYNGNTLTIFAAEGQFIKSVAIINASGNTVTSNHTISCASGSAIISASGTIKNIAAFEIEYGSGGFTDVDFRIKMAIDDMSDLAEEHGVTEYGVEISDGTTTRSYAFDDSTRTSTDTNGTKQYMVIGLGDVFANPKRLSAVFSLKAYAVLNGKKLYSTNVKQHSVVSLVESYHAMESYSKLVDPLYQYFVSVDLIDED